LALDTGEGEFLSGVILEAELLAGEFAAQIAAGELHRAGAFA